MASLGATWLDYGFDEPMRREEEPLDADWELTAQLFGYPDAEAVWQTVEAVREILQNYVDAHF